MSDTLIGIPQASPAGAQQGQQSAQEQTPSNQGGQSSNQQTDQTQQTPPGQAKTAQQEPPKQEEDYTLNVPEGLGFDANHGKDTKALAKELGLSKEAAQKIVDRDLRIQKANENKFLEMVDAQRTKWVDSVKSDKEIGGSNLDISIKDARAVIDRFGTEELKQEINQSGYGDNPEIIRIMARIGRAMREDNFVQASNAPRDSKRIADLMYPSMQANQSQ